LRSENIAFPASHADIELFAGVNLVLDAFNWVLLYNKDVREKLGWVHRVRWVNDAITRSKADKP
jgi:hypothetical protein